MYRSTFAAKNILLAVALLLAACTPVAEALAPHNASLPDDVARQVARLDALTQIKDGTDPTTLRNARIARLDQLAQIKDHEGSGANTVQIVPDANSQAVLAYLNAHKVAPADRPQTGPAANTQSVLGYLNAHSVAPAAVSQTYFTQLFQAQPQPDAIAQSYFLQLYPTQRVPDAATKGVLDYLRAHGANLQ